jgi:phosphomannomutase
MDGESAGDFPQPSPKRISLVSELTTSIGADMGIVLDNDCDRAVFIDHQGNIIREQTVLAFLPSMLSRITLEATLYHQ